MHMNVRSFMLAKTIVKLCVQVFVNRTPVIMVWCMNNIIYVFIFIYQAEYSSVWGSLSLAPIIIIIPYKV